MTKILGEKNLKDIKSIGVFTKADILYKVDILFLKSKMND